MTQRFVLVLLAGLALACGTTATELMITVDAPPACEQGKSLRLHLLDVELPRNVAANIRVYAKMDGLPESYVGLLAVMAEEGAETRKIERATVTATAEFRKSLPTAKAQGKTSLALRPSGGARKPLTELKWSVRAVEWACR